MSDDLRNLVKVEVSMFKLYDELLELKLNGKDYTKQYIDDYSLFLDCIPIEDKYIRKCHELILLSDDTVDNILSYSKSITDTVNFFYDDLENTVENNYITSRIINKSLAFSYGNIVLSREDSVLEAIGKINYLITKEIDYIRYISLSKILKIENDKEIKKFLVKYLHGLKFVTAGDEIDLYASDNIRLLEKSEYDSALVNSLYEKTIKDVTNLAISGILQLDDDSLNDSVDDMNELEVLCGEMLTSFSLCRTYYEKCNYINYVNQIFERIRLTNEKMLVDCNYALEKLSGLLNYEFNLAKEEEQKNINKNCIKLDKYIIKI